MKFEYSSKLFRELCQLDLGALNLTSKASTLYHNSGILLQYFLIFPQQNLVSNYKHNSGFSSRPKLVPLYSKISSVFPKLFFRACVNRYNLKMLIEYSPLASPHPSFHSKQYITIFLMLLSAVLHKTGVFCLGRSDSIALCQSKPLDSSGFQCVCMCTYVYAYLCIYVCIYIYVHHMLKLLQQLSGIYTQIFVFIYLYVEIHIDTYTHIHCPLAGSLQKCPHQLGLDHCEPRAKNLIQVSHLGDRKQTPSSVTCCFPECEFIERCNQEPRNQTSHLAS